MSAPLFVEFNTASGSIMLNADRIIAIKREGGHTNLMIENAGGNITAKQVVEYPSEIVQTINDTAKTLPQAFRGAALFIELTNEPTAGKQATHTYYNVGKITSFAEEAGHTKLHVGGMGPRNVQESEHIIGQKIAEALTARMV